MEEKSWFEQYDKSVPHSLRPYPQRTLLDIVSTTTQQRPDHIAMIFKGTRIAYSELERLSDAFSGLHQQMAPVWARSELSFLLGPPTGDHFHRLLLRAVGSCSPD